MLRLRDIMTTEVLTVSPDLSLRRAVELLVRHHLGGVPVTRGRTLVGVLSGTDILELQASPPPHSSERGGGESADLLDPTPEEDDSGASFFWGCSRDDAVDLAERLDVGELDEADVLDENTVDTAMTREVLCLPASATVQEGAAFMMRHGIHRVLVEEEGRLVGIVTTSDVTRVVGERGVGGGGHR